MILKQEAFDFQGRNFIFKGKNFSQRRNWGGISVKKSQEKYLETWK